MQQQRKEEELRRMPRRSARRVRQATRTTARFCDYISAPSTEVSILGLEMIAFWRRWCRAVPRSQPRSSGPPTFITGPAAANLEAIEPSDDASLKSTAIRSRSQPFGKMRLTLVPLCDCDGWLACASEAGNLKENHLKFGRLIERHFCDMSAELNFGHQRTAVSHLAINRMIRRSRIRCSMKRVSQDWLTLSKKDWTSQSSTQLMRRLPIPNASASSA
jgi:hypothetical protein